jgi:predicted phage terminase large subunit-like protein
MMNRGAVVPRIYPATDDGTPTGRPVFLSQEALDLKRSTQGPYIFACQQLLNPVADDAQGFKREWLRFETIRNHASMNKYLLVDPAGEKKKTNDYTVMWVVALGSDGNYYVLDGIRDRLNLTERAEAVFSLWDKYRPLSVGYEKYGLQSDIEFIEYLQRERNQRFGITKLGGIIPKNDRIRGLVPHFENGRIFLPNTLFKVDYQGKSRDIVRDFVEDEFTAFPVGTHDDMLDCLARILDPELHARFPKSGGGSEKSSKNRRRRKVSAMAA